METVSQSVIPWLWGAQGLPREVLSVVHHPFLTVVEHGLGLKTAASVLRCSEILFWNNAHVFCFVFLTSCLCGIPAVSLVGTSRDIPASSGNRAVAR